MLMLHVGCGKTYFNGWVNIDSVSDIADLKYDVSNTLPYSDDSVDFIYNEHFIEHLTVEDGLKFMSECYRVLKKKGILRIATPDLNNVMLRYFFLWRRQRWINNYSYQRIKTRAEMINVCFRGWGHQYLYNRRELERRLREAGFGNICKQRINKSKYSELKNRESRKESRLIIEAEKG